MEKSRQREQELHQEMDRLEGEIKAMQKSSEESANISQQLSKEVSICLNGSYVTIHKLQKQSVAHWYHTGSQFQGTMVHIQVGEKNSSFVVEL